LQLLEVLARTCHLKKDSNHKKLLLQLLLLRVRQFKQLQEQWPLQLRHLHQLLALRLVAEMPEHH
jgi:hypothetical protein